MLAPFLFVYDVIFDIFHLYITWEITAGCTHILYMCQKWWHPINSVTVQFMEELDVRKLFIEKSFSVPLCPPLIPNGLVWN
jgi:hypothetical protein